MNNVAKKVKKKRNHKTIFKTPEAHLLIITDKNLQIVLMGQTNRMDNMTVNKNFMMILLIKEKTLLINVKFQVKVVIQAMWILKFKKSITSLNNKKIKTQKKYGLYLKKSKLRLFCP